MNVFIRIFWCVVPSVTTLRMDASMTAFAQRNEIVSVVRTAFGKRQLVMDFLDRNDDAPAEALLTEGMGLNIAGTDPRPRSAVPTAYSRVTAILLVVFIGLFGVFLTVPVMCQLSASRPMAWVGRLIWHSQHLFQFESEDIPYLFCVRGLSIWHCIHLRLGIRKATEGFLPGGPVLIYSLFAL